MSPYFNVALSNIPNPEHARYAEIVIPRFDPPVNYEFLDELGFYDDGTRLFVNPPQAQRYFSNKKYLDDIANEHPELLPKTLLSSDSEELGAFLYKLSKNNRFAVYKPLQGFGGDGITRIDLHSDSLKKLEDYVHLAYGLSQGQEIMLQEFIENVTRYGDKRIHLLDGNPLGAVLRTPKPGSWLCNQKKGGTLKLAEISQSDYEIIEKINPLLQRHRAYWSGIDIVGPYLGEINAVSPGLLYALDEFNNWNLMETFSNQLKQNVKKYAKSPREVLVA
jgi:glutathione synthase